MSDLETNSMVEAESEIPSEGATRVDQWQAQIRRAVDAALVHHVAQTDKSWRTLLSDPVSLQSVTRKKNRLEGGIDPFDCPDNLGEIFPVGREVRVLGSTGSYDYGAERMSVAEAVANLPRNFVRSGKVTDIKLEEDPLRIAIELERAGEVGTDVRIVPHSSLDSAQMKVTNRLMDLCRTRRFREIPRRIAAEKDTSPMRQFLEGSFPVLPEGELEMREGLDDSQNEAFGRAMKYDEYPVLFVQGGPGTGKTRTTAEIIAGHVKKGRRVLLLSHSNKGAQVPALQLQTLTDKRWAQGKTHIAGNHPEKIDPKLQRCRIKRGMPPYPEDELRKINTLTPAEAIKRYFGNDFDDWRLETVLRHRESEIGRLRKQEKKEILSRYLKALEKKRTGLESKLKKGGLVVSTFGTLISDEIIEGGEFDVVIVDEATRMRMPELILALQHAGKQIIFIGDPVQLGNIPITPEQSETVKSELQNPTISSLMGDVSHFVDSALYKDESEADLAVRQMEDGPFTVAIRESKDPETELPYVFLKQNRRSLPNIVRVLSELMYKGKLKPGREPLPDGNEGVVRWHDTKHLETTESTKGTSKKNSQEAQLIAKRILDKIKGQKVPPEDIGVIATYASQALLIRSYLKRVLYYGSPENRELYERIEPNISTVDAFQGDQRKIVFVSLTRSNEAGDIGFLEEERRIGVAVGRAEDELHIFGNSDTVVDRNNNPESAEFFGKLKNLVEQYGKRVELPARKGKKK